MVSRFLRARPLMMKHTGPQIRIASTMTPTTMPVECWHSHHNTCDATMTMGDNINAFSQLYSEQATARFARHIRGCFPVPYCDTAAHTQQFVCSNITLHMSAKTWLKLPIIDCSEMLLVNSMCAGVLSVPMTAPVGMPAGSLGGGAGAAAAAMPPSGVLGGPSLSSNPEMSTSADRTVPERLVACQRDTTVPAYA